mmetsp:Transcript_14871/g.41084  ORF Transcript_14871/g.41084 Transcript_14871/m.41084 type:complete len:136 (+) Transcript_14871:154-561(+)
MKTIATPLTIIALVAALLDTARAFVSYGGTDNRSCLAVVRSGDKDHSVSRASFLSTAVVQVASMAVLPSWAADTTASKGSKTDPAFEACLSKCMYECTKPKGDEQKSRKECLPECKQQCATTKEQLMLGTPLKKD